ncbi:LysR family transcriptional regulator [Pseudomonas sp. UBA4194]|uniref:LysR family transcriptional regulator n=1 Tax=Pseudomonas sp. UBA4194 TaxID=1947317 RepID=UPI0025D3C1E6|nr:LysR family transcriptional regulator [Pseudomonas sp. UBA4194]
MESQLSDSGNVPKRAGDTALSMATAMDLKLFKVFKAVVEAGGFTAAQTELNIGLAAISKQISDLEIRLGMRLCTRGREKFGLTEQGKVIYQASLDLFVALDDFRGRLGNVRGELLGDLNIAVIDNTCTDPNSPLVQVLKGLQAKAPKARLRLNVAPLEEIEQGILKGRFAAGIVPVYGDKSEFEVLPLYRETAELYCSSEHPFFALRDEDIDDLQLAQAEYIEHAYAAHQDKFKPGALRNMSAIATQVEAVGMLVMTGRYLGYLPNHWARSYVERGQMRAVKPRSFRISTPFKLLYRQHVPRNPLLEVFLQLIQDNVGDNVTVMPHSQ